MSEGHFFLVHNEARRRAALCVQQAPDGYQVIVREPRRNLDQNALLWVLLERFAEFVEFILATAAHRGVLLDPQDVRDVRGAVGHKEADECTA